MVRIVVVGAGGRMGRQVLAAGLEDEGIRIVGGVAEPGLAEVGTDLGSLAGAGPLGIAAVDNLEVVIDQADVLVEFTMPEATARHALEASRHKKAMVIGTTGLNSDQMAVVREAATRIPIAMAPNMSVGVNLLFKVLPIVARALGNGYDIEIVEAHHNKKKDAPSGTALKLAEVIAGALSVELDRVATYGRKGIAPRAAGEIGMHSLRGGGVVGDHSVLFVNDGEQIEIAHRALSRQTFALGAIRAAKFVAGQSPGFYTMLDVLDREMA